MNTPGAPEAPELPPVAVVGVSGAPSQYFHYRIAGTPVLIDREVPRLAGFQLPPVDPTPQYPPPQTVAAGADTLFDGTAYVLGRQRRLRCLGNAGVYELSINGVGQFLFDSTSHLLQLGAVLPSNDLAQLLCGPLLPLALANRDCFLLHASAVTTATGSIAFCGASGAGKSTLAAAFAEGPSDPLADDALALAAGPEQPLLAGPFPQPKWPDWGAGVGGAGLPLTALVELVNDGSDPPETRPVAAAPATLTVIRHTIAGRLFGPDLRQTQLEFAAALAAATPVYALHYRQEMRNLPLMVEELKHHVA